MDRQPGARSQRLPGGGVRVVDTLRAVMFRSTRTVASMHPPTDENPYLAARRTWNEHVGGIVSSLQTWQTIGILALLVALAAVGGMIRIGSQSKFVPYIV